MQGTQGASGVRAENYGVSVLRMQQQDAKRQGSAEKELIDAVADVRKAPKGGNAPGVGKQIDVSG